MSKLEARNVVKLYDEGTEPAVKGSSFVINDGEFVAILGPSGCGKSSTLRMIAGLESITSGEILFDGKVVNDMTPAQRNIALAFESYALYGPMTVFENIAFPLRAAKVNRAEVKRRVMEISDMFDLGSMLKKKPGELSGGQQQRISLARALVRRPNIFLLDEPLSHMDQRNRADIRTRIKTMHQNDHITTIYVTHDQEEAVALADRVLVMSMGEIQQFGTVNELWNHPANIFVAGFIGEPAINFMEGQCVDESTVSLLGKNWKTNVSLKGYQKGDPLVLGFRPNKATLSKEEAENSIAATLSVSEFVGTEKQFTLSIQGEDYRVLVPLTFEAAWGDTLYLNVGAENLQIFDKNTTLAIV